MRTPFEGKHPVTYSPEDEQEIRQAILTDGKDLDCPICGSRLVASGGPGGRVSHEDRWELHCEPCYRFIVVEDSLHL